MSHPVKMSPKPWLVVPAILTALALPSAARGSTFPATELSYDAALLSQFNLINLGNLTATGITGQSIGGRALIGGNVTAAGTETVCGTAACGNTPMSVLSSTSAGKVNATTTYSSPASPPTYGYGALTVFGNVTASVSVANGGDINVKGSVGTGTYALNNAGGINVGGTSQAGTVATLITEGRTTQTGTAPGVTTTGSNYNGANSGSGLSLAQVFNPFGTASSLTSGFANPLTDLSRGIAALPGTPGVAAEALPINQATLFTSVTDYASSGGTTNPKYGVVTTTVDNLTDGTFAGVKNGTGNNSTFVIVTGQLGTGKALPTLNTAYANVLYDFVDATELRFAGAWNASILAPLANVTSMGGAINGSVVVASMSQSQSLNVGNVFNGDLSGLNTVSFRRVPEPASLAMLAIGVAGAAAARRRRRA